MFLSRILCPDGRIALALRHGSEAALVLGDPDLGALIDRALAEQVPLAALLLRRGLGNPVDVAGLQAEGRLLPPLPDRRLDLSPTSPGDERIPLALVPPGGGLDLTAGGALEGGAAALVVAGAGGQPVIMGWLQSHIGIGTGPVARRCASCGPELCLDADGGPAAGHARLARRAATLAEFAIPPDGQGARPTLPAVAAGEVLLHRISRWLLRPAAAQLDATIESRIAGLGLPLWNPLARQGTVAVQSDAMRRKA